MPPTYDISRLSTTLRTPSWPALSASGLLFVILTTLLVRRYRRQAPSPPLYDRTWPLSIPEKQSVRLESPSRGPEQQIPDSYSCQLPFNLPAPPFGLANAPSPFPTQRGGNGLRVLPLSDTTVDSVAKYHPPDGEAALSSLETYGQVMHGSVTAHHPQLRCQTVQYYHGIGPETGGRTFKRKILEYS